MTLRYAVVHMLSREAEQQKACLVPISVFLPDISPNRISQEFDSLAAENELFRVSITENREIQLVLTEPAEGKDIQLYIRLPHGYPNKSPVVKARSDRPIISSSLVRRFSLHFRSHGNLEPWSTRCGAHFETV